MRNLFLSIVLLFSISTVFAQEVDNRKSKYTYLDGTVQIGKDFVGSIAYGQSWALGKKKNFIIGTGIRFSGFTGLSSDPNEFYSAPPEFYGNEEKQDTLFINSPSQMNVALYINLSYRIKKKFEIGMNIDAIGYTFGAAQNATYQGDGEVVNTLANSNSISALLIAANDIGMLSSEFYAQYHVNDIWSVKLGFAHTFTEYYTNTELQEGNTRYRGVSDGLVLGVRYNLK